MKNIKFFLFKCFHFEKGINVNVYIIEKTLKWSFDFLIWTNYEYDINI
jgi:hypothetical protein